jgi:hypothetical protein
MDYFRKTMKLHLEICIEYLKINELILFKLSMLLRRMVLNNFISNILI